MLSTNLKNECSSVCAVKRLAIKTAALILCKKHQEFGLNTNLSPDKLKLIEHIWLLTIILNVEFNHARKSGNAFNIIF